MDLPVGNSSERPASQDRNVGLTIFGDNEFAHGQGCSDQACGEAFENLRSEER